RRGLARSAAASRRSLARAASSQDQRSPDARGVARVGGRRPSRREARRRAGQTAPLTRRRAEGRTVTKIRDSTPPRMQRDELVIILEYGSQSTQLIARRIRESHVYCEVHPFNLSVAKLREMAPKAIVLSGGPSSVYEPNAPSADAALFELGVP